MNDEIFTVEQIMAISDADLRFNHLARLKVPGGRDALSARYDFQNDLPVETWVYFNHSLWTSKERNSAARWFLRGLSKRRAVEKVLVDTEIAKRATEKAGRK